MNWNPWRNLRGQYQYKDIATRKYITTFWEKVVDAFCVLGGEMHYTLATTPRGSRLPIRITTNMPIREWDPLELISVGLIDYSPLGLVKLLSHLALTLFIVGMYRLPDQIDKLHPIRSIFRYIYSGLALGIGMLLFFSLAAVQFVLIAALTILSLPIIGAIHAHAQNQKMTEKNEFVEKYEKQFNAPEAKKHALLENSDKRFYHQGSTKNNIKVMLNAKNTRPEKDDDLCSHNASKLVLYSRPVLNPHHQTEERNYFFYEFSYTKKGLAAYRALCKINKDLCVHGEDRDKKITAMLLTFATLAQKSRSPEQPGYIPLETVVEIAIRAISSSLSLEDRRSILRTAKSSLLPYRGIYDASQKGTCTGPTIEEVTDTDDLTSSAIKPK